jgi:hypothetical protein
MFKIGDIITDKNTNIYDHKREYKVTDVTNEHYILQGINIHSFGTILHRSSEGAFRIVCSSSGNLLVDEEML